MEKIDEGNDSKELLESQKHVWNQTYSYMNPMALRCALQLGIPDILSNHVRPVTLPELVTQLSIPPTKSSHLYRLMRLLVHTGVFAVQKDDHDQEGYVLPSSSKLLLKSNWGPLLLMALDPFHVTPCLYMADWFRGSESTTLETLYGTSDGYGYLGKHPDLNTRYNEAMACGSRLDKRLLFKDLMPMLEGFESLVDVGGGNGALAMSIAEAAPNLRCSVYDLPHVIADAKEEDQNNITFVAGDMFESIPCANIILFKGVLTSFDDDDCLKILKQCRAAIHNVGKLVIIEIAIDETKPTSQLCFDVFMMTLGNGKQRTECEWKKLFQDAGFTNYKISPTLGLLSIMEVFP